MSIEFELEAIIDAETVALIARQLSSIDFKLNDKSTLNGYEIKSTFTQPRALKSDGNPDLEVFCFYLANAKDKDKFIVGNKTVLL
jgi:hypothetical protein